MNSLDVIDIIGSYQGLLFGFLILFGSSRGSKANTYLGLYLILLGISTGYATLDEKAILDSYPWLAYLPLNFHLAFPVLLFFYAREISGIPISKSKGSIWFIPGIVEFLAFTIITFLASKKLLNPESLGYEVFEGIYYLIALIFMIYFLVRIIRFITRVRKQVEDTFSDITNKTLYWLRVSCILILSLFFLGFVQIFFPTHEKVIFHIESIINTLTLIWVSIHGYKQSIVLQTGNNIAYSINESKSPLDEEELDRTDFDSVRRAIENERLYKRQQLTLNELASEVGLHSKHLSQIINTFSGKNFFNFINEFRVKEAQNLLIDESCNHLNFLGIAYESGFNSKATFNAAFKKVTGTTPRNYRNSKRVA